MTNEFSSGMLAALEDYLRHPPPFECDELERLRTFRVTNDQEPPRGLERLTGLVSLGFDGCEVVDFGVLRHMPGIFKVTSWASNATSVASLPEAAPRVDWLDITVGQVRDLRPLLDLPLKNVKLAGNPVDEYSFREVYPELRRRGAIDEDPRMVRYLIHEREWELMQRFVERGLRLSAYQVGGRTQINAPGQLVHTSPEGRGVGISVRQAGRILDENAGIDERGFLEEAKRVRRADGYVE